MTGGLLRRAVAVQVLGNGGCCDVRQLAVGVDAVFLGAFQQVDGKVDCRLSPLGGVRSRGLALRGLCFLRHVRTVPLTRVAVQYPTTWRNVRAVTRSRSLDFQIAPCHNDPVFNPGAEPGRLPRPGRNNRVILA